MECAEIARNLRACHHPCNSSRHYAEGLWEPTAEVSFWRLTTAPPVTWHVIQVEAVVRSESPVQPTDVMAKADTIEDR